MTQHETTQVPPPEWTILYHNPSVCPIKGRGEFLKLMFEDAKVPYVVTAANLYGPKGMMDAFRGSPEAIDHDQDEDGNRLYDYPLFYPPAVWHRPPTSKESAALINQVAACMSYIGEQLGYNPKTIQERARADCITQNCLDYIGEGRASFHPVKNTMSYKDQKEEGDKKSKEFSQFRMKLFLHHFNKIVSRNCDNGNGSGTPIAGGPGVTYADFCLFHVLDATAFQFNSEFYDHAWDNVNVPFLKEYYQWMKIRPNLQSYFVSDRCGCTYPPYLINCIAW
jgi:Glutathione S-transferase, C-terminal domain